MDDVAALVEKSYASRENVKKNVTSTIHGISLIHPRKNQHDYLEFKNTGTTTAILLTFPEELRDFWNEGSLSGARINAKFANPQHSVGFMRRITNGAIGVAGKQSGSIMVKPSHQS